MTQATEPHPALNYRCRFCHADPAEPCRARNRCREQAWPHFRRIALTQPGRRARLHLVRRRWGKGCLDTRALKCDACSVRTRHALSSPENARWRDAAAERQRVALGGKLEHWSEGGIEHLRREYRQMYRHNSILKRRYWVKEAKAAWDDGRKQVSALCEEPMAIDFDPYRPSEKEGWQVSGRLVAEQFSDTEYEDPGGLCWIDMDCVDCCRGSDANHWTGQRKRPDYLLAWFARHPEEIAAYKISGLSSLMERLVCLHNGVNPD